MLLQSEEKLEELLVRFLARRPASTAKQLHVDAGGARRPYSVQAVYQTLRSLERGGIVVKTRGTYTLRLAWVLQMLELTAGMYENYLNGRSMREILPEEGKRTIWHFRDLHSVAAFYSQLGLALLQQSGSSLLLEHVPHVWYHLAYEAGEMQFLKALRLSRAAYCLVVAADDFLDRQYKRCFAELQRGELSFGRSPFSGRAAQSYFMVAGPYVVELKLESTLEANIDVLFQEVHSASEVEVGRISDLFRKRGRISLVLQHQPAKAARLTRAFTRFLGTPAE